MHPFIFPKIVRNNPVKKNAMLVFTDGSSNRKAAYVIDGKEYVEEAAPVSAQIVELQAVAIVFFSF